ncbi:MAG: hypothetical protein H8E38_13605 [SAR324 cluster bacterium]|nr:hypothetical protein [SAR324 cluster bacterium]MBL7036114.1 hypothetical protein [SAR324 cluster bacterium]
MYKLHLDRELTKDLFDGTSKEIRDWVVNAIANIVIVDDVIEKSEFVALREAIELLDNREEIEILMQKLKDRKLFKIEDISMDHELAVKVFFYLAAIAVIDGNLKKSEVELLNKCGVCLGLADKVIRAVTNWSVKQMEINSNLNQALEESLRERNRIVENN